MLIHIYRGIIGCLLRVAIVASLMVDWLQGGRKAARARSAVVVVVSNGGVWFESLFDSFVVRLRQQA